MLVTLHSVTQSNPVNMDTEGSLESVHINEVFLLY